MRPLSLAIVLIGFLALFGFAACGDQVSGNGEEGWELGDDESDGDGAGDLEGDGDGANAGDGDGSTADGEDGDGAPGDSDPGDGDGTTGDGASDQVYQSEDPLFEVGSLSVNQLVVNDGPYPMLVFLPPGANTYPVLVFHHGFVLANSYYTTLLERVASHGFVVLAPQLYETDDFLGLPTTEEEADRALAVYEWLLEEGASRFERDLDLSRFGLVGHSRGTKVMYRALAKEDPGVLGLFGLDPVDGTGGPLGGDPSVMGELNFNGPRFFLGAGLGPVATNQFVPACAPEADGFSTFFADASTPTTLVVVEEYGHMDMLNDNLSGCGLVCSTCTEGPSKAPMREYSAAAIVAFFQSAFFGTQDGMDLVTDENEVSVAISVETK